MVASPRPLQSVFINLERAGERRRFMEKQARRLGIEPERFAAVDAADLSDDVVDARGRSWQRPLTRAEIGCFLSHETLWQRVKTEERPLLILEDDVVLSAKIADLVTAAGSLSDVDFLNLESCDRRRFIGRETRRLSAELSIRRVFRDKSGSGAYILWPSGARKLLSRSAKATAPVDAFLHASRNLASYQVEPALAMQLHILEARGVAVPISSATFIQAPRQRLPVARDTLRYHWRRLSAQLRLGVDHVSRLGGRRYRSTEVIEADFAAALAEDASGAATPSPAHRRS